MGREVWIYQLDYPKVQKGIERILDYLPALKKHTDSTLSHWRENANSIPINTAEDLWNLLEEISTRVV